ncbi:hypothetical protein GU926_08115 [Nibribacter ruber]|uniref:Phage tail protein n=1 Tax=Nibribacter ruber TaxID=2698458 RepID=A0A6P1NWH0_9BACT|nr:hypothetical protein [Nibribacter ruber]QHL87400.1 hypothetical protein GU926_08115 [Nibribacter ruber]
MREFIALKLGDDWLDLPADLSIQIEIWNTLFEFDRIPGTLTFPFTLPFSAVNNLKLKFPGHLSVARYRQPELPCQLFLMGQLWRMGKLNVIRRSEKGYEVNFQTDVGDISVQIKEAGLRDIDYGTVPLQLSVQPAYPESSYALFPVRNLGFSKVEQPDFSGYQNFYDEGFPFNSNVMRPYEFPVTPFPYLVHVLKAAMAHFGYTVTGDWLEEEAVKRLVVFNTRAYFPTSADPDIDVVLAEHVPDMKVNEFLKAIRSLFSIGFVFNPLRKEMEVVRLRDVVADRTYVDWSEFTGRVYEWEPAPFGGFTLAMEADPDDEQKQVAFDYSYQVGDGLEDVPCQVATLPMVVNYLFWGGTGQRDWLVPVTQQEQDRFSFRVLAYHGLQPNNDGTTYPLGTSGTVNRMGDQISSDSLEWDGPHGLYLRRHKPWLDFLDESDRVETEQALRIHEILSLNHGRRCLIRHEGGIFTGLWEKVSFTISKKNGLKTAKVPIRRNY